MKASNIMGPGFNPYAVPPRGISSPDNRRPLREQPVKRVSFADRFSVRPYPVDKLGTRKVSSLKNKNNDKRTIVFLICCSVVTIFLPLLFHVYQGFNKQKTAFNTSV